MTLNHDFKTALVNCQSLNGKSNSILEKIIESELSLVFLTETWINENSNDIALHHSTPDGYTFLHTPRKGDRKGGGVAIITRSFLTPKDISRCFKDYLSFEFIVSTFRIEHQTVNICVLYRPPPSIKNNIDRNLFLREFGEFLEIFLTSKGPIAIFGDFNIHYDNDSNNETAIFKSLLDSLGLQQHVSTPTHDKGHILDLIITRSDDDMVSKCEVGVPFSDHNIVESVLCFKTPRFNKKSIEYRKIHSIDVDMFKSDIESLGLSEIDTDSVDVLVSAYE